MEIVLLQDIRGVGLAGEIVKVKRGFAVNYLFPRSLATPVTPEAYALSQQMLEQRVLKQEELMKDVEKIQSDLTDSPLVIMRRVTPEGTLYGGVNELEIVYELSKQKSIQVEKRQIQLSHGHLKTLGLNEVDLHLADGVHITVPVEIQAENPEDILEPEVTEDDTPDVDSAPSTSAADAPVDAS